jgi:hypothetical protein
VLCTDLGDVLPKLRANLAANAAAVAAGVPLLADLGTYHSAPLIIIGDASTNIIRVPLISGYL